jgi:hypothetical protein
MTSIISSLLILTATLIGISHTAMSYSYQLATKGWKITAEPEKSVITIEYEKLGVVIKDLKLHMKNGNEWQRLSDWKVVLQDQNLSIMTEDPVTEWTFNIRNRVLGIHTSVKEGMVTATAPADKDRFPARMLDYSGKARPVSWRGTDEIGYSYGGNQTVNISFLPEDNPDVLYLSLGQVSSRNMQCLFDRKTDTMIRFLKNIQMEREENVNFLKLSFLLGTSMNIGEISNDVEMMVIYSDYYTQHLKLPVYSPIDEIHFAHPPVMWNSWTNYYSMVTEEEVIKNVDWIYENFNDYGIEYIVIDDGPDRSENGSHYWISNWNTGTFPHGPEWLTEYIHSKGLKAGLWVVPNVYAGALEEHPDWYLRDEDGNYIMVYNTPSLDYTHPGVLNFLTTMFTTLKVWGFEYYKFDGEFALTEYIPDVDKKKIYDPAIPPVNAYRNRLKVIRDAVGNDTFLEGCPGGTPLQGIGYFNSYFNGGDIYNSWLGMYEYFESINANLFLNHVVCYIMPGEGICVSPKIDIETARKINNPEFIRVVSSREKNISSVGTTMNEARTVVTFAGLSGTPYSFADRLPNLPVERISLLKKTLPTLSIIPMDLFSRGGYESWNLFNEFSPESYEHNFPRIIDLKINSVSGNYDVVAATNWTNEVQSRSISFGSKLGLDPERSYLVFDFWNKTFLGLMKDRIDLDIEPHDTRVLNIRQALERPQLLTTDRHISSSYSIEMLEWEPESLIINGRSKNIPDTPYSLFFYLPAGYELLDINADSRTVHQKIEDHLLSITLNGRDNILTWSIRFKKE